MCVYLIKGATISATSVILTSTHGFLLVSMTTNICSAEVSLSNTRGLATVVRLQSDQYCILQTLINIQESWLIPKQPLWPLPWPQMNKVVRRAPAVHEMQLFSAALGLYVTVFQKTSLHSLLSVACSKGKHLVIKERRCFLNVTTCSLIEGMFGCRGFTEDKQKIKAVAGKLPKSAAPSGQPHHAILQFEQQVAVCVTVSKK